MRTPEIEELERLLSDDAPKPTAEFRAHMEERLEQGFARRRRFALRVPAFRRPPRLVLAGVASAGLALSVTVALLAGGDDSQPAAGGSGGAESAAPAQGGAAAPADSAAQAQAEPDGLVDPVAPGPGIAPGESERQIERSAQLTIAAPARELERAAEQIASVADRHSGFVLRSSVSSGEDGGGGEFELRIPQDRLRPALRDLAAIGEVRARSEQGQDVTAALSGVTERLEDVRSDRRGLLRRLERADTDAESRAIRRRLRLVSAEIRALSRELRGARERVAFATVVVTLEQGGDRKEGGGAGAAFDDALGNLEGVLAGTIRALGVLLPLALLALAGWLLARPLRRRRRDAALG